MDFKVAYFVIFLCVVSFIEFVSAVDPSRGHYRCAWYTGLQPSEPTPKDVIFGQQTSCSGEDSDRVTSYMNYCTKQNYVPLLACKDTGQWNCDMYECPVVQTVNLLVSTCCPYSFLSMCKTIIRSDPMTTSELSAYSATMRRKMMTSVPSEQKPTPSHSAVPNVKQFSANENYFTMKEMAIAVLVSFITGATMLALVIFVVWRWRNCHVDAEQRRAENRSSMKQTSGMEPLQMLGQLAQAIGIHQGNKEHNSFVNPNYGQMITARDLLEDVINEQDRAYEEILMRRKSSCHPECMYATVDKTRVQPGIVRTKSGSDLKTIDESAGESDVGYDGDINTPQTPRRYIKYITGPVYSVPRSPAVNETRFSFGPVDAESLRYSLNHVRVSKPETPTDNKTRDIHNQGAVTVDRNNADIVDGNKSDSGYMEEMMELHGNDLKHNNKTNDMDHVKQGDTERRPSLRL